MKKEGMNYWTTSKGSVIKIKDMNTSHIKNAIRKIRSSIISPDTPSWRSEYLPILENELKRRNLTVAATCDTINQKEKKYFLEVSCGYTVIRLTENDLQDVTADSEILNYFTKNYFVLDNITTEEFRSSLIRDLNSIEHSWDKKGLLAVYEEDLLDNVFSEEWKNFIDVMLGRRLNLNNNEKDND